jgi:hypothetical protein
MDEDTRCRCSRYPARPCRNKAIDCACPNCDKLCDGCRQHCVTLREEVPAA